MHVPRIAVMLCVLPLLALAGCGGQSDDGTSHHGATHGSTSRGSDHDQADVSFAQQMIPHHQQAIEMAALVDDRTDDADVRALAAEIAAAQEPEIQTMKGWLDDWGEDVPESGATPGHHQMGGTAMPGMMGEDDLRTLADARGPAFDRLFLTQMIGHHEGAVMMARMEIRQGKSSDAVALARSIETSQTQEIARMKAMLAAS